MSDLLHVAHIIFRFDFGGLENGLINLVNQLPANRYRHSIIALTECTDVRSRLQQDNVQVYALQKRPGKDPKAYWRLYRLLRRLRPDVVHTRNVGTLDCQVVAWAARVHHRVHGEHGWDVGDPHGTQLKGQLLRKALRPFVGQWVALSRELETWLVDTIGVPPGRLTRICNGVDVRRFQRAGEEREDSGLLEFGTVTRLSAIKDPLNTVEAFIRLVGSHPRGDRARLTIVGDGPLRGAIEERVEAAGLTSRVRLVGSQLDVAPWLQRFHVFVLGSLREGISNTILEAMASGLPVVASDTGGNPELVDAGTTGLLVPPSAPEALAAAMARYLDEPELVRLHGANASHRAQEQFSIERMVGAYDSLYRTWQPAAYATGLPSSARK